jgi:hypothetical protein
MYRIVKKTMVNADSCSAMETETIQKNGVSPKNLIKSRINLFLVSLFAAIALSVFCSSCTKDDDEKANEDSIVGLWHLVRFTPDIVHPTDKGAENVENGKMMLAAALMIAQGTTIEFKADGTFILTVTTEKFEGKWKMEGDRFSLSEYEGSEEIDEDSFLTAGSSVTLKDDVLTILSNNLDTVIDKYSGKTHRDEGFTKYDITLIFKKRI